MALLELNGDAHVLLPLSKNGPHIRRLEDPKLTARFSQGQQTLSDIDGYVPIRWPNLSLGLGRYRIDSDSATNPDEYRRFWDSGGVDTRWADACGYLPILEEDSTEPTGGEVLRASTHFKGDLWAGWDSDQGGTQKGIQIRKYTGSTTTWEGGQVRDEDSTEKVVLDIDAHKTHLGVLYASANDQKFERTSSGTGLGSATTPIALNLLSNSVGANENIDAGLLTTVGGEWISVIWHEANGTITFFSSTDAGDNWTDEAVDIASSNGPQGVAVLAGIDNEDKLYVGTREGLWEVDTAPSTWTFRLIFPMVADNDNCRRMTVHSDGALWFAQGVDDDTPPTVYRMFVSDGGRTIERVPNDFSLGDGLVAEKTGPVRRMVSVQGQMWITAGGGKAGRKAWLGCHNGKGWHIMRLHGTANQKIEWIDASADDDGTPRLHYAVRTSSPVSNTKFLGQAFVNPRSGVSIKRESSGFVDLPYVDGGFALDPKIWLRVGINAEDLSAANTGEHINVDRGITTDLGALTAQSTTDVGDFLQAISRIALGTNGVGVSGLVFGGRVNLLHDGGGTNTDTPIWKDLQVDAIVDIAQTDRYEFLVDLEATAALQGRETTAVFADLRTARRSNVLVPLAYADLTDYVKVIDVSYEEAIVGQDAEAADSNARRLGTARVVVSEVI